MLITEDARENKKNGTSSGTEEIGDSDVFARGLPLQRWSVWRMTPICFWVVVFFVIQSSRFNAICSVAVLLLV